MPSIRARAAALAGALAVSATAVAGIAAPAQADTLSKIGFCHATGSASNPYVYQTTSLNNILAWAAQGAGNGNHAQDILPNYAAGSLSLVAGSPSGPITPATCRTASTPTPTDTGSTGSTDTTGTTGSTDTTGTTTGTTDTSGDIVAY